MVSVPLGAPADVCKYTHVNTEVSTLVDVFFSPLDYSLCVRQNKKERHVIVVMGENLLKKKQKKQNKSAGKQLIPDDASASAEMQET